MITSVVSGPRKPNTSYDIEEEKVRGVGGGKPTEAGRSHPHSHSPTTPPWSLTNLTVITRDQFVSSLDGPSFRDSCRGHKTNLSSKAPV